MAFSSSSSSSTSTTTVVLPNTRVQAPSLDAPPDPTPTTSSDRRDARLQERMEMVLDAQPGAPLEELLKKLERLDATLRDLEARRPKPKPKSVGHRLDESLRSVDAGGYEKKTEAVRKLKEQQQDLDGTRAVLAREVRAHFARLRTKEQKMEELANEEARLRKDISKQNPLTHRPTHSNSVPAKSAMKPARPSEKADATKNTRATQEHGDTKTVRWDDEIGVREIERMNESFDSTDIISAALCIILVILIVGLLLVGLPDTERQRLRDVIEQFGVANWVTGVIAWIRW